MFEIGTASGTFPSTERVPYEYIDSFERFSETKLPAKEAFYRQLNDKHISEGDYEHAQKVWQAFICKNLGDYQDLYVTTDVLLLADVFENFRELGLKNYVFGSESCPLQNKS